MFFQARTAQLINVKQQAKGAITNYYTDPTVLINCKLLSIVTNFLTIQMVSC